jgi:hypothetical protein
VKGKPAATTTRSGEAPDGEGVIPFRLLRESAQKGLAFDLWFGRVCGVGAVSVVGAETQVGDIRVDRFSLPS